MKFKLLLFVIVIFMLGCRGALENSSLVTPAPIKSEYFTTTGAGFTGVAADGRLTSVQYAVILQRNKDWYKDFYLKVCFESPINRNVPICQDETLPAGEEEIVLKSQNLYGLKHLQNYQVTVEIYEDLNSEPISTHSQLVRYYDVRY